MARSSTRRRGATAVDVAWVLRMMGHCLGRRRVRVPIAVVLLVLVHGVRWSPACLFLLVDLLQLILCEHGESGHLLTRRRRTHASMVWVMVVLLIITASVLPEVPLDVMI